MTSLLIQILTRIRKIVCQAFSLGQADLKIDLWFGSGIKIRFKSGGRRKKKGASLLALAMIEQGAFCETVKPMASTDQRL